MTGLPSERVEGSALLSVVRNSARDGDAAAIGEALRRLGDAGLAPGRWLEAAEAVEPAMTRLSPRADAVERTPWLEAVADRWRAVFGSWYEMFPRSQGTVPGKASTLREAESRLPQIARLGFDVLYLPPVSPIGVTKRKGRNASLTAGPNDPGSPWGIGSSAGGHDAVEPALGTMADFDHFVAACRANGLEIALDIALQCSPDHPWVKAHPDWFYRRPDGTIRFAENPPKKYEDIYPLNFDTPDWKALWTEIRRVFQHWIDHGVRIFRVDNPHTKPQSFWRWLISDIQGKHPDVFFLAEAFTRPPMMRHLAKIGFTQSYTYFTWRNTKQELIDYVQELAHPDAREFYRPNFFANTPDILPIGLVHGGRPAFMIRLILAGTLSPSYGIYSGFELCENAWIKHQSFANDVEYKDSEKFEIKVRDWNTLGNINDLVSKVNGIRRENPALQSFANIRFLESNNDQILVYAKANPDRSNVLLVAVNLDPHHTQEATVRVPPDVSGAGPGARYEVRDLLTGAVYAWSEQNYIRLNPHVLPAHILRIERRNV